MRIGASLMIGSGLAAILWTAAGAAAASGLEVTNLVSDGAVPAAHTDPNLINPWGVSSAPGGDFWVSDNNSGLTTLYNTAGAPQSLVVTIAPPSGGTGPAAPTGQVYVGGLGFKVSNGSKTGAAAFIFDTEDGTISGWAPSVNATKTELAVDNSASGAVYKGLAIASIGSSSFLYAANFEDDEVEVYNSSFDLVNTFTDPNVAAGYAPFNVQTIDGKLVVTYALQDSAKHDNVAGAGLGYVDIFNLDGTLDKRLVSAGGMVDAPWGVDIAPASFGKFAGDLLVGNFGDGTISAFNFNTGAFEGQLTDSAGNVIDIEDLWALVTGSGGSGGLKDKVYFTAGLADEGDGLIGSIGVPEPQAWALMLIGCGVTGARLRRRRPSTAGGLAQPA
jgi:uncharacterized protein (TIGR03118 family)